MGSADSTHRLFYSDLHLRSVYYCGSSVPTVCSLGLSSTTHYSIMHFRCADVNHVIVLH